MRLLCLCINAEHTLRYSWVYRLCRQRHNIKPYVSYMKQWSEWSVPFSSFFCFVVVVCLGQSSIPKENSSLLSQAKIPTLMVIKEDKIVIWVFLFTRGSSTTFRFVYRFVVSQKKSPNRRHSVTALVMRLYMIDLSYSYFRSLFISLLSSILSCVSARWF